MFSAHLLSLPFFWVVSGHNNRHSTMSDYCKTLDFVVKTSSQKSCCLFALWNKGSIPAVEMEPSIDDMTNWPPLEYWKTYCYMYFVDCPRTSTRAQLLQWKWWPCSIKLLCQVWTQSAQHLQEFSHSMCEDEQPRREKIRLNCKSSLQARQLLIRLLTNAVMQIILE